MPDSFLVSRLVQDLAIIDAQRRRRHALRLIAGAGAAGLFGCGSGASNGDDAASASSTTSSDSSTTSGSNSTSGTSSTNGTGSTSSTDGSTGSTSSSSTSSSSGNSSSSASDSSTSSGTTSTTTSGSTVDSCTEIPEETAGPYPADGTNTANGSVANALTLNGIVRSDIRSSIAGASGTADGVAMTITLKLVDSHGGCANLDGYAVYLWHCDRLGRYSLYSSGITGENYLRGVQASGIDGTVTFTTIFPGCYSGRMPHVHFEIYRSLAAATSASNRIKTSQLALPTDVCRTVYQTATGYTSSLSNLNSISFATDNVFSDGYASQLATVSGSVSAGYAATLVVGVPA